MNSVTRKAGIGAVTAFGVILIASNAGVALAQGGLPEGFKKGELAPEPSAEMIEAGKRVYFTKCVVPRCRWCR